MAFEHSVFLNDGNEMPRLGFGVYKIPNNDVDHLMSEAIATGYRLFDTASIYQNEEGVGKAMKNSGQKRENLFITTKLWNDDQGSSRAFSALDESLSKLQLDYVDLYLIHWPAPHRHLYVESWRALIKLKKQGKVKSIGVSNFTLEHLEKIIKETGVVPAVNQIELHPRFQQKALRAFHETQGIKTESWGPLGRGKILLDPILQGLAAKYKKTTAQVVIRWHLQNGLIAIPKTATASRIRENWDVFDFILDVEDMKAIEALDTPLGRTGPHPCQNDF